MGLPGKGGRASVSGEPSFGGLLLLLGRGRMYGGGPGMKPQEVQADGSRGCSSPAHPQHVPSWDCFGPGKESSPTETEDNGHLYPPHGQAS